MKTLFVIFFMVLSAISLGQKKYSIDDKYTVTLLENSEFKFYENCWCPIGCEYGEGNFILVDDILTLNFRSAINLPSFYKINSTDVPNDTTQRVITILVMEDSVYGLAGANVYYHVDKIIQGTSTNFDGIATLHITDKTVDSIYISFIGIQKMAIPIMNSNMNITAFPSVTNEGIFYNIYNETRKYKITRSKKLKRIK